MNKNKLPPNLQKVVHDAEAIKGMGMIFGLLERCGLSNDTTRSFREQNIEIQSQAKELTELPLKFNALFQERGWLISESTNINSAKEAVILAEKGKIDDAEGVLIADYTGDKLDFVIMSLRTIKPFAVREHILQEAAFLCQVERYMAAIPLLFSVVDGVGQDYFKKSLFSEGADLTELNALAGQSDSLSQLVSEICRTRKKLNDEPLTFPYRNGILHGRDINYNNPLIAAKLWSLVSCVGDVIRARESIKNASPEQEKSLKEKLLQYRETIKHTKMIEDWKPRIINELQFLISSTDSDPFDDASPEKTLVAFLHAWKNNNYGEMGKYTVYFDGRPIKKRAGEIRKDISQIILLDACILEILDEAAAMTEIKCRLTISIDNKERNELFSFRLIYGDECSDPLARNHKRGTWKVMPSYQGWAYGVQKSLLPLFQNHRKYNTIFGKT